MKEIALVYLVAGISKRYGGKIKHFVKVGPNGESLVEYSIKQALPAGFTKIIFIVSDKTKPVFEKFFGKEYCGIPVFYALQNYNPNIRDKPWGTVDALCCAKDIIDCPFVVCGGDDIFGENSFKILAEHLRKSDDNASIGYKLINVIPEKGKVNRGIFQINKDNYVKKIIEVFGIEKNNLKLSNTKSDDLCSMNFFALHPKTVEILNLILENFKEKNKEDREIECLLSVEISKLIEDKKINMKTYPANDKWFGVTNPGDEEDIRKKLGK